MTSTGYIQRLPTPTSGAWEWQADAPCRGMPSPFFFHPWGERGSARKNRVSRAKLVCANCTVIDECRAHALTVQDRYGVWGGLSDDERLLLLNRHRSASTPPGDRTIDRSHSAYVQPIRNYRRSRNPRATAHSPAPQPGCRG